MINSRNIHQRVHTRAFHIRQKLREELKGKLLALKVDGATRHDRSVLGVNVQFFENGKIQIRTLAMVELSVAHTGENLKDAVLDVLHDYGLTIYNMYSLTSDNAPNMIKISKLIGKVNCDTGVDNLLALPPLPPEEQGTNEESTSEESEEEFETEECSEEQTRKDDEHAERLEQLMDDLILELSSVAPEVQFNTRCESIRFGFGIEQI